MNDLAKIIILFVLLSLFVIITGSVLGLIYAIPSGNVAEIRIEGDIVSTSDLLSGGVSSDAIISQIKTALSNPNVEAILLSINSPGGMVVASKEVAEYVKSINKTVVAQIREIGASGAYLIAAAADYIICDNLSITGSIGVTDSYLEFAGTMTKYGVEYNRLVTGEHKDIGSQFRNMTAEERDIIMGLVNESFSYFLNFVTERRNLTEETITLISDGRIIGGSQAYSLGLVDELGGINEVKRYLSSKGIEEITIDDYSSSTNIIPDIRNLLGFKTDLNIPSFN
ncbi:Peptidase family S49 [Candidatus Tiddalikarchaeum anstoanum]|nr:Peptidase family S49 [Candidatus Tiddalikarchaeum anstoanum]